MQYQGNPKWRFEKLCGASTRSKLNVASIYMQYPPQFHVFDSIIFKHCMSHTRILNKYISIKYNDKFLSITPKKKKNVTDSKENFDGYVINVTS